MSKEIAITVGYNAAGKSTFVQSLIKQGVQRINRDMTGGSLEEQVEIAKDVFANGGERVVLDNTYPTVQSRKSIIALGKKLGIPVICLWMQTSFEDAQLNACLRMVKKTGSLLGPDDFKKNKDPNLFPPAALFAFRRQFEPPTVKEGFATITKIPFVRTWGDEYKNKAIIVDYDGTLRSSTGKQKYPISITDIKILPGRTEKLKSYQKQGYLLLGVSNQSGIAKGSLTENEAIACFDQTNSFLDLDIEYHFCPHKIPPVTCYCRKPHPGLGALLIEKHKLRPSECIMVGDMTTDETFARRCGFLYMDQAQFFA